MKKDNIKKCTIIYNPVSTGFKENSVNLIAKTAKKQSCFEILQFIEKRIQKKTVRKSG